MSNTARIVNIEELRSIVKVDIDNGFDKVARELTDVLASPPVKLSAREYQFIFAVISKTYRFKKKVDWIASVQLAEITGISITNISKVKKSLIEKKVLVVEGKKFGINTLVSEWQNSQKRLISKTQKQSKTTSKKSKTTSEQSKTTVKQPKNDNNIRESINTIDNNTIEYCSEDKSSKQESKIFISLPLNRKNTFHDVSYSDIAEYKSLFQSVSVELQLRKMCNWLNDNPKKRKTSQGVRRFITSWLQREQDKPKRNDELPRDPNETDLNLDLPSWVWG